MPATRAIIGEVTLEDNSADQLVGFVTATQQTVGYASSTINVSYFINDAGYLTAATGQQPIQFQDDGMSTGGLGAVQIINFTGTGVTSTYSAGTLTVAVSATGGGISEELAIAYALAL